MILQFRFMFYVSAIEYSIRVCIAHGVTTVKQYYNSHGLTSFLLR